MTPCGKAGTRVPLVAQEEEIKGVNPPPRVLRASVVCFPP